MGNIRVNLIGPDRSLTGLVFEPLADALRASLAAEPETIAELENALRRFIIWEIDSPLNDLREGEDPTPGELGILSIDLASRTVLANYLESVIGDTPEPGSEEEAMMGERVPCVWIETPLGDEDGFHLPYFLSSDWLQTDAADEFAELCETRKREREANPPIDFRAVLYGRELSSFVATECANIPRPPVPNDDRVDDESFVDPAVTVHKKWYMTPREDLGGRTPRDYLFYKRHFMELDLQWRETQWSFSGACPPHIPTDTNAYRFSGVSVHEWVIYYYLVRELIGSAIWDADRSTDLADEVERLEKLKTAWLNQPSSESSGRVPAGVIESSRRRIGLSMSSAEVLIDEDCPCCQAMAADFTTPMFWHLDGTGMDEGFEFAYEHTREEWEAEQRRWAEMTAEWDRERAERAESGEDLLAQALSDPDDEGVPF